MKDALQAIALALLVPIIFVVVLAVTVAFGYFAGMVIAVLPFVPELLTGTFGISEPQIPTITAWLAVAGLFIGGSAVTSSGDKNGDRKIKHGE